MKLISLFLFFCVVLRAQSPQQQYEKLKNEMLSLKVDESRTAEIKYLQLKRDAGTFSLRSGTLYALSPINGSVQGVLFVGEGTFAFSAPTEVEKKQLFRFYGKEALEEEVESVFFLFNDSTYKELSKVASFIPADVPSKVKSLVQTSLKFIENKKRTTIDYDIFRQFLFNEPSDFFFSHIITKDDRTYFFIFDPYEIEEIKLQRNSEEYFASNYQRETLCKFYSMMDHTDTTDISHEKKSMVKMSSYEMDNTIQNNLDFTSKCMMTFTNLNEQRKWISFELYSELLLDSVAADKESYFGVKDEESDVVWIGSEKPFPIGKEISITLYYHGDLVHQNEGWYSLKSSIGWYPWPMDERQYTTFNLTFHSPKNLTFATIGKMVSCDTTDSDITSHWILNKPVRNASFILGKFTEFTTTSDDGISLTLYSADAHDAELKAFLASQMVPQGSHMEKQISDDIKNSFRLFQQLFGKLNIDHLYIAEIPGSHGESFPGLMHLSWITFQDTRTDGSDEIFRAHEIAHQWWASGVDYRTYHDQWLSEAFAEYSGLWYMQLILHDNDKFFDKLEEYKTSILSNRKYLFSKGQEAGPIWLGYRTQSSSTEGDYSLIIYRKGAWVLHMLRNLAIDLKTMNEDVFNETLKDFYTMYAGSQASTEDFKRVVEKHFGIDLSWFFNQWVYGTEIPVYSIQYKCNELPSGKYTVHCTVRQKNVSDNFQMSVPFYIDFGDNQYARFRYLIKGPVTEFDFPVLPLKPDKIRFNDLESVLCEIEDEDWE